MSDGQSPAEFGWSLPAPAAVPAAEPAGDAAGPAGDAAGLAGGPAPALTGHPSVDTALRSLAAVAGQSPSEQLPAYQAVHRTLRETLASIDEDG